MKDRIWTRIKGYRSIIKFVIILTVLKYIEIWKGNLVRFRIAKNRGGYSNVSMNVIVRPRTVLLKYNTKH